MATKESFTPHALCSMQTAQSCLVTLKITSPLFYAQISRCKAMSEHFKVALSKQNLSAATFHTSHPDLLTKLFEEPPSAPQFSKMWPWSKASLVNKHTVPPNKSLVSAISLPNRLRWLPIQHLRRLPSPSHYYALSDLDAYAAHLPSTDALKVRAYRKAVLKMLLSDYVAFGIPALIDAALWIIQIWLCWLCVRSLDGLVGLCNGHTELTVIGVGKVTLGYLGVHLWSAVGEVL